MAARKKKATKKAARKTAVRAVKKTAKKAASSKRIKPRRQPETLRLRSIQPGFTVNDIERSVKWYTDVLGFVMKEPWMNEGKMMGAQIRAGASSIYLGQDDFKKGRDRVKGIGVRLYCDTAQDLDKLAEGIKQRGGTLDHEPQTQPWGTRDFGITDPDGYRITISSI
jgi:uncharacterized glyoxalase superfamily protein PhnB